MVDFLLLTETGTFEFSARHVSLGRDRRCSFRLPDASVQPLHAEIVEDGGRLFLEKRHRDALTFVNRAPIHQRVELFDGDLIDIGPWTLVIRSRHLARRQAAPAPAELSMEFTPSDPAIVKRVRLPKYRTVVSDDTSSSIIII